MTRRSRIWFVVAVVFSLVNMGGAVFAALKGEPVHTGVHAGLLLIGGYLVWRLAPQRVAEY